MKYFTAIVMAFLAGCYAKVPTRDDAFEITATVYVDGIVVSNLKLGVLPGAAFSVSRHVGGPEPVTVGMAMVIDHGESRDTVRVARSIDVNDRVAEPDMNLILGSATDIELDGADLIVRMTVNSAQASAGMALRGTLVGRALVLTRTVAGS